MFKRAFSYAILAALLGLGSTLALADNSARIVRLSLVDGKVTIDRADGQGDVSAIVNMPIVEGAVVRTGSDGYAELEFERGSTVRLAPRSELRVDQLGRTDDGKESTALAVSGGLVYFELQKHEAETFRVAAGGQQITIPKNARFRVDTSADSGEIAVLDGAVRVSGSGREEEVKKDHTLRFGQGEYEIAKGVTSDSADNWNSERTGYRNTYSYNSSPYRGYSSSYVYGLSDLNYWGNYYYAPGWGWVWRPYDVGYGWSPFMNGAWAYYPSWGWTWVSTYPWGWTPYRYGSWVFVPSYGWAWQPTNTWSNWHAIPPATAPAAGGSGTIVTRPLPPSRPPVAGSPNVLLVNRGPRWEDRSPGARPGVVMDRDRPMGMRPGVAAGSPSGTPRVGSPATGARPDTAQRPSGGATMRPATPSSGPRSSSPSATPRQSAPPRATPSASPRMSAPPARTWSPPSAPRSAPSSTPRSSPSPK